MKTKLIILGFILLRLPAFAAERGALVRVASLYLSPDPSSTKLADIDRGREVILLERSGDWLHVEAGITQERVVTGWMLAKGAIFPSTPDGDKILYGEAVDSEDQASQRHGRRDAAQDAMRLYYRVADYFPTSPLAAQAMYRSADIRWQIEKADISTRPSARERDPYLRQAINEEFMKEVMKKYPGTKWADLAAFHLIDNKLCGDWQGESKCPTKEAGIYEKYAAEHPQSPAAPEALYDAASRYAALIEIYKTEEQPKKSDESRDKALELSQKISEQFAQTDWGPRAERLHYLVSQNIPTYGNALQ